MTCSPTCFIAFAGISSGLISMINIQYDTFCRRPAIVSKNGPGDL
jgi:hypothetical protein